MPRSFTDAKGRNWDVSLSLAGAMRIDRSDYSELTTKQFSMLKPDKELLLDVLTDTPLLFAMIWALVQPQAEKLIGITDPEKAEAEFLEGLNGQAIQAGREAFWGAVADFFPEHQTALLTLLGQYQKAGQRVAMEIKAMEADIESLISEQVNREAANLRRSLDRMRTSGEPLGAT